MLKKELKKISIVLMLVIFVSSGLIAQVKLHKTVKPKKKLFKKLPDLIVHKVKSQERTMKSGAILKFVSVTIRNIGDTKAIGTQSNSTKGYVVDVVLGPLGSKPPIRFAQYSATYKKYCLLKGGRIGNTPDLAPGASHTFKLRNYLKLPKNTPIGNVSLFAIVDPGRKISELKKTNNTNSLTIKIKFILRPMPISNRFKINGIKRIVTDPDLVRFQVQYYIDPNYRKPCFIGVHVPNSTAPNRNFSFVPAGRLPNGVPKGQKHFTDNIFVTLQYNSTTPYTSSQLEVIIYNSDRTLKKETINWGQTWDGNVH